jgi:hypothetical protein
MKKIILVLVLLPTLAWSRCVESPSMGKNFFRCDNAEAICYFHIEGRAGEAPISCFRK